MFRVHRGVYALGHPGLSREGVWLAAVFACGEGAVLSHGSAAALWGLLESPGVIHVTVPGDGGRRRRDRIRLHRSVTLNANQVTRRVGIPVTTPSRTLADLRRTVPSARYARALREAQFLGLPLDARHEPDRTRSELEARLLALCRRHRLPPPRVNVRVGPYLVDFAWPEQRLVVEVDGFRAHGTRSAFEADRARDADLKLRGYEVVRFTWSAVGQRPREVVRTLRALLRGSRADGS
jgi:very-short-patch-repair endonuclease